LQIVLDTFLNLLHVEKCALFLVDYTGKSLVLEKASGKISFDQIRNVATYNIENYDPSEPDTGVTPWVLFRKKPFNAKNFAELQLNSEGHWKGNWDDPMYGGHDEASKNFQCVYMVPLLAGNDSIGVLKCENRTSAKTYFDQEDERVVDILAQLISNLVISQRIERNRYDYALPLISNSLVSHFGQKEFYENLLRECMTILNADLCSLFLVDGKGNLNLKEITGVSSEVKAQLRNFTYADYKTAKGLTPWILKRRAPFNVRSYPDLKGRSEDMHIGAWDSIVYADHPKERFKSLYSVPLIVGDKPIGVFKIENKNVPPFYFTESDERLFDLIGRMIAIGAVYDNEKYIGVMLRAADAGFLASGIAHEMNNDLMRLIAIAGNIEELASGERVPALARALIDEAKRAARTIEDFRKIRGSREEIQECDTEELIQRLLSLSKERCKNNNIKLNYRNEGIHRVRMNQTELQTIIINLLNNAFESIAGYRASGIVDVVIRPVGGGSFQIEVSDSGKGISKEEREFIFTPFYTTKAPKGMGIGLYWVQRLVNGMSGTISVESPNKFSGTSFYVDLPITVDAGGTHE
jgi:signal transduction histidine kinase